MRATFHRCELGLVGDCIDARLVSSPTPDFLGKQLRPHLHFIALDITIDIVCAEDAAVLILLAHGVAHR